MAPTVPTATLNNNHTLPLVGLGCWMGEGRSGQVNDDVVKMVETAIKLGYRHFDIAKAYGNEEALGQAVRASGIPREEFFITTKLHGTDHGRVAEAFQESLDALDLGYIDLYLMHWPQAMAPDGSKNEDGSPKTLQPAVSPTYLETWSSMEQLLLDSTFKGKVKALGVSNFSVKLLTTLLATCKIIPAVDQVEGHPYLPQTELEEFCKDKGIHLTAYCPLGQYNSPILQDEAVLAIAEKHGKTAGQVLLSWAVQKGWSVVPKSSNPERLAANLETFTLPQADHDTISKLHTQPGKLRRLCAYGKLIDEDKGLIFGWTFEEMGWDKHN